MPRHPGTLFPLGLFYYTNKAAEVQPKEVPNRDQAETPWVPEPEISGFAPAAESPGLWPWMNAQVFGRDVARMGVTGGATSLARGAPPEG